MPGLGLTEVWTLDIKINELGGRAKETIHTEGQREKY